MSYLTLQDGPLPVYKLGYTPYKLPYKRVSGVITQPVTNTGTPCGNLQPLLFGGLYISYISRSERLHRSRFWGPKATQKKTVFQLVDEGVDAS